MWWNSNPSPTLNFLHLSRCCLQAGCPTPFSTTPPSAPPTPSYGEDEEDQTAAVAHSEKGGGWGRGKDTEWHHQPGSDITQRLRWAADRLTIYQGGLMCNCDWLLSVNRTNQSICCTNILLLHTEVSLRSSSAGLKVRGSSSSVQSLIQSYGNRKSRGLGRSLSSYLNHNRLGTEGSLFFGSRLTFLRNQNFSASF